MIQIPLTDIIAKIQQHTKLSDAEIDSKISAKLEQLSGLISKEGAAHIIANELGVKLLEQTSGKVQIKNVLVGMRDVELIGKVLQTYETREFNTNGRAGKVTNLLIGDETGTMRLVGWGSKADDLAKAKEGDILKVKSGYVKENTGRKEVHLNDKSSVMFNPPGETVSSVAAGGAQRAPAKRKKIAEITEDPSSIEVFATVVQTFEPRFFEVCPHCSKRVKQLDGTFTCSMHSTVTPDYSSVLNLILDDGTETIRTVFFGEQVQQLVGKSKPELLSMRASPELFNQVKLDLLGKQISVVGRAAKNQLFDRLEFRAFNVNPNPDPKEELKKLA